MDVLWVIDNSCSMLEEQTTLINNFGAFIGYFLDSQLDWHIGVTSTDMTNGGEPGTQGILRSIIYPHVILRRVVWYSSGA